jgi:hypothetical protein
MGWNDWGAGDWTDTTDLSTTAIDAGTQGDVPQAPGSDWSMPDWGSVPIGAMIPNIGGGGGSASGQVVTQAQWGPAVRAGMAAARYMAPQVFAAITKLSQKLGGASSSVAGYGRRVWQQLSTWAAKNPGVSLVATLTSIGLTVEEAAHFVSWGATHKRKRRTRGINGRDIRITRRTIRKLVSMTHLLGQLRGGGFHRSRSIPLHRHRVTSIKR